MKQVLIVVGICLVMGPWMMALNSTSGGGSNTPYMDGTTLDADTLQVVSNVELIFTNLRTQESEYISSDQNGQFSISLDDFDDWDFGDTIHYSATHGQYYLYQSEWNVDPEWPTTEYPTNINLQQISQIPLITNPYPGGQFGCMCHKNQNTAEWNWYLGNPFSVDIPWVSPQPYDGISFTEGAAIHDNGQWVPVDCNYQVYVQYELKIIKERELGSPVIFDQTVAADYPISKSTGYNMDPPFEMQFSPSEVDQQILYVHAYIAYKVYDNDNHQWVTGDDEHWVGPVSDEISGTVQWLPPP